MADLVERARAFIREHELIRDNDHVLVAVSGGMDSVVLLHVLFRLKDLWHLRLEVIHLNHGLRDGEADRDQQFVEQLAKSYHLPVIARQVSVPQLMKSERLSEEQAARKLRYRFFEELLEQRGADLIALGHQADDQAETVMDHFLRGSGVKGLAGMPVRRGKFIRPLLFATRNEIETYATANSLDYVTDSTNAMVRYRRNRIRHELIPYLQKHFNPAITDVLLRTSGIMDQVEQYLDSQAELAWDRCCISIKKNKIILDIDTFLNYFSVIQKYVLYQLFERIALDRSILTAQRMEQILTLIRRRISGKRIRLTNDWQLWVNHDQVVISSEIVSDYEIPIVIDKHYQLPRGEGEFVARLIDREELPAHFSTSRQVEYIDYDKISGALAIRNFRTGDRFRPLNGKGEKKLSDFFIDLKIPLHRRKNIPLLVCESGIVWIVGYQIDDRFKLTDKTKRILRLQIKRKASA